MNSHLLLGATLALALAGCGGPTEEARPAARPAGQASAPARPAGPVLRYDGRYSGPINSASSGYSCVNRLSGERSMTVSNGRASLALLPGGASPLQGVVQEDGSLRVTDLIDRSNAVTGQIVNDQFVGVWRYNRCDYNLNFRRQPAG